MLAIRSALRCSIACAFAIRSLSVRLRMPSQPGGSPTPGAPLRLQTLLWSTQLRRADALSEVRELVS